MSQRDDELLTMLRAELARRASTTPREGFDMRMHTAVRELQRPRGGGHRLFTAGVALATIAAVAVALAAGLRAHQNNSAKPPLPAPSPAATGDLYVLVEPGGTGVNYSAARIRFVRRDGTLERAFPFPGGPSANHDHEIVAGGQLFYVTNGAQDQLQSIGVDGVVHDHGSVSTDGWILAGVAVSADGRHWAWSEGQIQNGARSTTIRTRLHVAGAGEPAHVILDQTAQVAANAPEYTDVAAAWTDRGIVVTRQAMGIGGGPYLGGYWHRPRLVDPLTGAVRALDDPQDGVFYDMGPDGSYVTVVQPSTVDFVDAHGGRRHATVADPVRTVFAALVAPDGAHVALGVREADAMAADGSFALRTDVLDVATGRATRVASSGYVPAEWLADGSLVLYDGNSVFPGSPGANAPQSVEVLAANGKATFIGPGEYIGVAHR